MNVIEKFGFQVADMGPRNCLYEDGRADYSIEGIELADTVIDIGSCFGSFQLMVAESGFKKQVIAVEPLWYDISQITIDLNNLNVQFIPRALGPVSGEWILVNFHGRELYAKTITMSEILESAGKKIFLKCDCEGAEWCLTPADFKNVIRAEIEFHDIVGSVPDPVIAKFLDKEYYIETVKEVLTDGQNFPKGKALIVHLYRKTEFPDKKEARGPLEKYFFT